MGKLYAECGEDSGNPKISRPHTRTRARNDTTSDLVLMEIVYEGKVNFASLKNLLAGQRDVNYFPDEDLRALNILSWKTINENWSGGRILNKFYPPSGDALLQRYCGDYSEYWIRTGFFSSMRPGKGSLLLNVNTTTSAFYPVTNLQRYMNIRGARFPLQRDLAWELKGLKVTFSGDRNTSKADKKRTIWSIDPKHNVSQKKFPFNNVERTVFYHMKKSKLDGARIKGIGLLTLLQHTDLGMDLRAHFVLTWAETHPMTVGIQPTR